MANSGCIALPGWLNIGGVRWLAERHRGWSSVRTRNRNGHHKSNMAARRLVMLKVDIRIIEMKFSFERAGSLFGTQLGELGRRQKRRPRTGRKQQT